MKQKAVLRLLGKSASSSLTEIDLVPERSETCAFGPEGELGEVVGLRRRDCCLQGVCLFPVCVCFLGMEGVGLAA